MRKNNSETDDSAIAAAAELDTDEEIVETVSRTLQKNKRTPKPKPPVPAEPELIDAELVDDDADDDDADDGLFAAGTLGDLLTRSEDDHLIGQQCNILVVRKPDTPGEKFAKPCIGRMSEPPLRNLDLTTPQGDIEEMVRANYLGGHYLLQIQLGNTLGPAWSCDLADPPDALARLRAADPSAMPPPVQYEPAPAAATPQHPVDAMLESITKFQALREGLFGERERQLATQIEDLKRQIEASTAAGANAVPQTETLVILEKALSAGSPELTERLLDYAFPSKDEGSRHWVAELADVAIKNRELLGGLLGSLLGGGGPPAAPHPQPSVADMLRQPPPPNALPPTEPPPGASAFKRRSEPPASAGGQFDEPATIDAEPFADAGDNSEPGAVATGFLDVETEPSPETDARPKGRKRAAAK